MRIGVVTTSYPRAPGDAAGVFVADFARWLAGRGHGVDVVAAGPGAPVLDGIPVSRVVAGAGLFYDEGAPERLERSLAGWLRAPVFSAALAAAVRRRAGAWDAVVSHWLLPSSLAVSVAAPRLPHLAVAHSGCVHLAARPILGEALVRRLLAGPTCLAFTGEHLRRRLTGALTATAARRLRDASFVCPMGIDARSFVGARRDAARRALGLDASAPVVGFLGRLVPIKGASVLLDAAARIGSRPTLLVGGDGPERTPLEARARSLGLDARFVGPVPTGERASFLAALDVLAIPSVPRPGGRTEGAPVVALEALAAGVPVVASAAGALAELPAVRRVPARDAGALARALAAALEENATDGTLALGRDMARAHDWSVIGPRLLDGLESVCAPVGKGRRLPSPSVLPYILSPWRHLPSRT